MSGWWSDLFGTKEEPVRGIAADASPAQQADVKKMIEITQFSGGSVGGYEGNRHFSAEEQKEIEGKIKRAMNRNKREADPKKNVLYNVLADTWEYLPDNLEDAGIKVPKLPELGDMILLLGAGALALIVFIKKV